MDRILSTERAVVSDSVAEGKPTSRSFHFAFQSAKKFLVGAVGMDTPLHFE